MLLLNKNNFLKLPAGVFYIQVGPKEDPSTAMITNGIMVKGTTPKATKDFDCYEGNLSFAPTDTDTGEFDWPCIGNLYDESTGVSGSMDINLTITRGGIIGEDDLRFIILEPNDLLTMMKWMAAGSKAMGDWLKSQPDEFPKVIVAGKGTHESEDFC